MTKVTGGGGGDFRAVFFQRNVGAGWNASGFRNVHVNMFEYVDIFEYVLCSGKHITPVVCVNAHIFIYIYIYLLACMFGKLRAARTTP